LTGTKVLPKTMDAAASSPEPLSKREGDVLRCLARGLTDKETAAELGIAYPTVRVYRRRAEEKLGARGVTALLVAWRLGEINLEVLADEAMAARQVVG
jgi:DNA-binding CsgD family transcriptional regulator